MALRIKSVAMYRSAFRAESDRRTYLLTYLLVLQLVKKFLTLLEAGGSSPYS